MNYELSFLVILEIQGLNNWNHTTQAPLTFNSCNLGRLQIRPTIMIAGV
ncbi:uncharacterized protein RSE6_01715 [Rhynchosporium secalis]|uniref:Uncharacterized protein n=1 Tax=Rhynchosporium secalis TaxID=38038 RepID=A0A1E1LYE8_RHYSE|nr:uncharacterized protein RSE6_01715 [Rhynchosporium secalis]